MTTYREEYTIGSYVVSIDNERCVWCNGGRISDPFDNITLARQYVLDHVRAAMMDELGQAVATIARTHNLLMTLADVTSLDDYMTRKRKSKSGRMAR